MKRTQIGKMKRHVLAAFLLLVIHYGVKGQKTTEMFIPIGKSPGVSGILTWIGEVQSINENYTVTLKVTDGQSAIAKIDKSTRIYLDRSSLQKVNSAGTWKDITYGATIEIKYAGEKKTGPIEWVKVKVKS